MSNNNAITVKSYDEEFQTYVDNTASEVSGTIKVFIDMFLGCINKSDSILEIGSGTGRDADYIEEQGYKILRTDAAQGFVKHMHTNGHKALELNIVNEALPATYDAIFANAVFLHFDDADFASAIGNIRTMLKPGGIFALSLHKGTFKGMSDHKHSARYFHEWTDEDIKAVLIQCGFEILSTAEGESISKRKKWIMLILRKL